MDQTPTSRLLPGFTDAGQVSLSFIDDRGETVHAHGGQILHHDDAWWWIGEDRRGRVKVSCYRSEDLRTWDFRGHLLTLDSPTAPHPHRSSSDLRLDIPGRRAMIGQGCNIERPKLLYHAARRQWVMWMHWELPDNYHEARAAVAVCDRIDGDYTYLGSFRPLGHMSRDCTVFHDTDGSAWFISAARDNRDLHIYRLSPDYLDIERLERVLWPGGLREAPTVFRRGDRLYMLTSGCTGWRPNQSSWATARSMDGGWSERRDFGDQTTFASQPTWVLPLPDDRFLYIGDRWGGVGRGYPASETVFLPISFSEAGEPGITADLSPWILS